MLFKEKFKSAKRLAHEFPFETIIAALIILTLINPGFFILLILLLSTYPYYREKNKHVSKLVYEAAFKESISAIKDSIPLIPPPYPEKVIQRIKNKIDYFSSISPEPRDCDYFINYFDFCVVMYLISNHENRARMYDKTIYERYVFSLDYYKSRMSSWENDPFKKNNNKPEFNWLDLAEEYSIFVILSKKNQINAYKKLVNIVPTSHILHPNNFNYNSCSEQGQKKMKEVNNYYKVIFEELFQ